MKTCEQLVADKVTKALESLGSNYTEVATSLREMGFKGDHCAGSCPIATFLKKKANVRHPCVISGTTAFSYGRCGAGSRRGRTDNPEPVKRFIQEFDAQVFPDLDTSRRSERPTKCPVDADTGSSGSNSGAP